MSGLLSKQRLLELLGRLNEKLAAAEERGEIYIVGGAMMVLAHGAERRTRDIDCHVQGQPPRGARRFARAFLFEKLIRSKLRAREQAVSGDDPEVAAQSTRTAQRPQSNGECNGGWSR